MLQFVPAERTHGTHPVSMEAKIMRRFVRASSFLLLAAVSVLLSLPASAQSQERQELQSQVSASADAKLIGRMPGSQRLSLAVALPLRNEDRTPALAAATYDPPARTIVTS